jgi:hypothetical protein
MLVTLLGMEQCECAEVTWAPPGASALLRFAAVLLDQVVMLPDVAAFG